MSNQIILDADEKVLRKVGIKYLKQHSSSTAKSRIQSGNKRYAALEDTRSVDRAYKLKYKCTSSLNLRLH